MNWFVRTCNVLVLAGITGAVVAGLTAATVITWEYTNSSTFCAQACHGVHPEEAEAYGDFYHARVKCVECHLGRLPVGRAMLAKASHMGHLWSRMRGGYERPLASRTMRPAHESCERCHWPPAFHDDSRRVVRHFKADEANSEVRILLTLHTGGGIHREGRSRGIHWHIGNTVRFIAADDRQQQIPWVEVVRADGSRNVYVDAAAPLPPETVRTAIRHVMDCVDCHNRVGHPFESPSDLVDDALASGRIDPRLPYAKAWILDLMQRDFASRAEAVTLIRAALDRYEAEHPQAAERFPEELEAGRKVMEELLLRIKFEAPGVSWASFPDNNGHRDFPGCFRCHDGRHLDADGRAIRLHCNLCHDIPQVAGRGTPPAGGMKQPESHLASDFMRDHGAAVDGTCAACHGTPRYGTDDRGFCSNSACHGRDWPGLDLHAAGQRP